MADELNTFPSVFGRYLLLRRLARGGMGEVFLAKSGDVSGFERLFVIKKILPELSQDPHFMQRFVEEAQIAIKLNHINIAHVFEVGMVGQDLFLALEYVEGRDLRRILSRCYRSGITFPQDLALFVAREICNGLSYAHRRTDEEGRPLNLVHCDISPPNVLVSFEGEVKIIDFGVAKSALGVSGAETNVGFGKLGYMAPEQLLKGRTVDHRADIYAAGVVLYEMLVGDRMIALDPNAEHRENVRRIVLDPVVPPSQRVSGLDPRLDDILLRAVAKSPEDRFQKASEFRDAIQRVLSDLNPTISVDDLAEFLRQLFEDELEQDRAIVRQAHATDLAPYREELDGGIEATVSYAVTNIWESRSPEELPPPPVAGSITTTSSVSGASAPVLVRRSRLPLVAALGAAALGLVIVVAVLLRGSSGPASKVVRVEPRPEVRPEPTRAVSAPRVVPLAQDAGARPRRPRRRPRARPRVRLARRVRPRRTRVQTARPAARPEPRPVDIQAEIARLGRKFRRVQAEYATFKARYGGVLEKRWENLRGYATWGMAREKDKARWVRRMEAKLNAFRRAMARVRQGGGP